MKKSYFLSVFLFFTIYSITSAQTKNYLGIGTSFDMNKSIVSNNTSNNDLQPIDFNFTNYSIHTFLNLNSDKSFQFRVNARLNAKTTRFASEDLAPFGDLMINTLDYSFLAIDVGLMGLYAIPLNENNKLLPALGIFGSYNFSNRSYFLSRTDGTLLSVEDVLLNAPARTNEPEIAYVGFNTGLLYQTKIRGRFIEFYGMVYFSPADSFEATFEYENIDNMNYEGKQQSIALGVNIPILLKRNKDKNKE